MSELESQARTALGVPQVSPLVAEVLGDLVHGRAQPQPGGRGVVPEGVAAKAEGKLANDADRELATLLIGEQVVVEFLPGGVLAENRQGAR